MDPNPFDATQQHRYYSRSQAPNEHDTDSMKDHSSYPQPQYAHREHSDPAQSRWTPSVWPNTGLSRTPTMNSALGQQFPSLNENVFDVAFQQPAPWTSLSSSNPNGTPTNLLLLFPVSNAILASRTSSAMMNPITAGASSNPSRVYEKIMLESNGGEEEKSYSTITLGPVVTSLKADALHKVAWGTPSRRDSEPKGLTPPEGNEPSVDSSRTSRKPVSKNGPASNKSDSDSESNHRSKGRLNHDLTEKRYRKRLNHQFENLLSALPARLIAESEGSIGGLDDRRQKRISKAEVLMLAKGHIEELEQKQGELKAENRQLAASLKEFEEAWVRGGWRHPLMP